MKKIALTLTALLVACGSSPASESSPEPAAPSLQIVRTQPGPLRAVAGDALKLKVIEVTVDGTVRDLPPEATVVWTSPAVLRALAPDANGSSLIPESASSPGAPPAAAWIDNGQRTDRNADLTNVLFIFDPGVVQNAAVEVSATVAGMGDVRATIAVAPTPTGDWARGAARYRTNCAACHGPTGHGSPEQDTPKSYGLDGHTYDYPAPGLNAEPGNVAGDPEWNAALLAVAARADIDNHGLALRAPMPDWLAMKPSAPLTTQDFADIYAFLKTETH